MQVQAINTNSNQQNFSGIFCPKNTDLNKMQKPVADAIKKALREPLYKFKGKTAERFYESKGFDFEITPYTSESVSLTAYKGMKKTFIGENKMYTYFDRVYIGKYDKNSEFKISDIEAGIKDKNKDNLGFIAVALTAIASLLLIPTLSLKQKIQDTAKPLIEKVDSAANNAKAALPDTAKVFKFIKK